MRSTSSKDLWVFGYGSLIWNPDVPVVERRTGHVHGFARRLYQGSTDHRGDPDQPGRVVTLVEKGDAECSGVAFRVPAEHREEALARLDDRELVRGGYERKVVPFQPSDGAVMDVVLYVASEENALFMGPAKPEVIAAQVGRARGRCGTNREYLTRLASSLRALQLDCDHVFSVERALVPA